MSRWNLYENVQTLVFWVYIIKLILTSEIRSCLPAGSLDLTRCVSFTFGCFGTPQPPRKNNGHMDGTWQHLTQGGGGRGGVVGFAWGHMPMLMVIYFCMQKVIRDINQTLLRSLSLSCRTPLTLWNVRNVWLFAKMPKAPICQSRPTTLIVESVALLVWKSDLIKGPLLQQIRNW